MPMKITVCNIARWHIAAGDYAVLPCKVAVDRIGRHPFGNKCKIVPETSEEVDASKLDGDGRYWPPST